MRAAWGPCLWHLLTLIALLASRAWIQVHLQNVLRKYSIMSLQVGELVKVCHEPRATTCLVLAQNLVGKQSRLSPNPRKRRLHVYRDDPIERSCHLWKPWDVYKYIYIPELVLIFFILEFVFVFKFVLLYFCIYIHTLICIYIYGGLLVWSSWSSLPRPLLC